MINIELKKEQTIIFDGDSATNRRKGDGLTDWPYLRMMKWNRNWADIFAELMFCWKPELNLKMKNVAVGGSKSYEILERFDEFVKPHNPDWVFVTIGGNDIAVKLSLKESQDNFRKYITKVQDDCDGNVIYLSRFKPAPHCPEWKVKMEQERVERALRESEARYRSLVEDVIDTSKVGVFILDKDFRIVWLNNAIEQYFGIQREDVIGKDKRELIEEKLKHLFTEPDVFAERVLTTYDNNTYMRGFECHVVGDGHEERWLEYWSQPIKSGLYAGGRVEHYTDITELKHAQEELMRTENILSLVLEGSDTGFWDWNLVTNTVKVLVKVF